jgi:hypothetical protein
MEPPGGEGEEMKAYHFLVLFIVWGIIALMFDVGILEPRYPWAKTLFVCGTFLFGLLALWSVLRRRKP